MKMKSVFNRVVEGFDKYMGTSELRSFHCPIKSIRTLQEKDGVSVERLSNLYGYFDGLYGMKTIYVNDLTGDYYEDIKIEKNGKVYELHDERVTTYRCGLMTCLAISKFGIDFDSVGFIGNGRTNIQNCKAITEIFGKKDIVIRGSENNRCKNITKFVEACGGNVSVDVYNDMRRINECDIVVVCTSSYKKEDMISTAQLSNPKLIIALDSGYLLDESFRAECNSFTEHQEQMNAYYDEEFPYDYEKYEIEQLDGFCRYRAGRSVVYLHGIGLADIIVANEMIKEKESCNEHWEEASIEELRLG